MARGNDGSTPCGFTSSASAGSFTSFSPLPTSSWCAHLFSVTRDTPCQPGRVVVTTISRAVRSDDGFVSQNGIAVANCVFTWCYRRRRGSMVALIEYGGSSHQSARSPSLPPERHTDAPADPSSDSVASSAVSTAIMAVSLRLVDPSRLVGRGAGFSLLGWLKVRTIAGDKGRVAGVELARPASPRRGGLGPGGVLLGVPSSATRVVRRGDGFVSQNRTVIANILSHWTYIRRISACVSFGLLGEGLVTPPWTGPQVFNSAIRWTLPLRDRRSIPGVESCGRALIPELETCGRAFQRRSPTSPKRPTAGLRAPGGSSSRGLRQFRQLLRTDRFRQFDEIQLALSQRLADLEERLDPAVDQPLVRQDISSAPVSVRAGLKRQPDRGLG